MPIDGKKTSVDKRESLPIGGAVRFATSLDHSSPPHLDPSLDQS